MDGFATVVIVSTLMKNSELELRHKTRNHHGLSIIETLIVGLEIIFKSISREYLVSINNKPIAFFKKVFATFCFIQN